MAVPNKDSLFYFIVYLCLMDSLPRLNLPPFRFKTDRDDEGKLRIFDSVRKKWLILTPEEWVRQHMIHYLIQVLNYPEGLMQIEARLLLNGRPRRFDILIRDYSLNPYLLIECKAPSVDIGPDAYLQAAAYQSKLNARYVVLTNGLRHYCFCPGEDGSPEYMYEMPEYNPEP